MRIRTMLEMIKAEACDVVSAESEMGATEEEGEDAERDKDSEGEK